MACLYPAATCPQSSSFKLNLLPAGRVKANETIGEASAVNRCSNNPTRAAGDDEGEREGWCLAREASGRFILLVLPGGMRLGDFGVMK